LSKGFGVIHRFSEDIDIRIAPPKELEVKTGRHHNKVAHVSSRRAFYDWLATKIRIPGIFHFTMTPAPNFAGLRRSPIQQVYQ
jgi:hypothetical protein